MTKEQRHLFYHFLTTIEHSEELFTVITDIGDNHVFDPEKLHMAILEIMDDLKKQHTWIPVSDPPKEFQEVVAHTCNGKAVCLYIKGKFHVMAFESTMIYLSNVTHWMPINPLSKGEIS